MENEFTWDDEVEVGYLRLGPETPRASHHQRIVTNPVKGRGELILDFDEDGRLLGVEFLDTNTLPQAQETS